MSAAMADAEPEAEDGSEDGGGGARAPPGQSGTAARVAPLGPEQLRQVLEQVTKAQPPAEPPPPPFVLQDAARRLRDAAQQAALQRGPDAEAPRPPRLLPPQVRRREGRGETEARRGPRPRGGRTGARVPARRLRPRSSGRERQRPPPPVTAPAFAAPPRASWAPCRGPRPLSPRCSGRLAQAFVVRPAFAEPSLCPKLRPGRRGCGLEQSVEDLREVLGVTRGCCRTSGPPA